MPNATFTATLTRPPSSQPLPLEGNHQQERRKGSNTTTDGAYPVEGSSPFLVSCLPFKENRKDVWPWGCVLGICYDSYLGAIFRGWYLGLHKEGLTQGDPKIWEISLFSFFLIPLRESHNKLITLLLWWHHQWWMFGEQERLILIRYLIPGRME